MAQHALATIRVHFGGHNAFCNLLKKIPNVHSSATPVVIGGKSCRKVCVISRRGYPHNLVS
jgi:hypothetical protein